MKIWIILVVLWGFLAAPPAMAQVGLGRFIREAKKRQQEQRCRQLTAGEIARYYGLPQADEVLRPMRIPSPEFGTRLLRRSEQRSVIRSNVRPAFELGLYGGNDHSFAVGCDIQF